jgi:hypothetical protein
MIAASVPGDAQDGAWLKAKATGSKKEESNDW